MGKFLNELKPSFGDEKWFKDAEKREKLKTDGQRELDQNLFKSCYERNSEKALRLLDEGSTNDYHDGDGRSPLHAACYFGLLDVAKEIEKRFPEEINRRVTFEAGHFTPLGYAFHGRSDDIIIWGAQDLIKFFDIQLRRCPTEAAQVKLLRREKKQISPK